MISDGNRWHLCIEVAIAHSAIIAQVQLTQTVPITGIHVTFVLDHANCNKLSGETSWPTKICLLA